MERIRAQPWLGADQTHINLTVSDGTVVVDGRTLALQGAGVRKKLVFSVYVGALYLTTATSDGAKAIAADESNADAHRNQHTHSDSVRHVDRFPEFHRVRLMSSGTEAVMTALRLTRGATGRPQ